METDRSVSMVTFVKDSFHSVKGIGVFFLRSGTPSIPQTALHKVYLTSQPGPPPRSGIFEGPVQDPALRGSEFNGFAGGYIVPNFQSSLERDSASFIF